MKNIPIGEVLKEYGYITEDQLQSALAYQKQHSGHRLGDLLVQLGYVTEKQVLEAMAQRLNLKTTELSTYAVDTEAVAKIPKQLASKYNMIAVGMDGGRLTVVMSDPLNFYAMEDIRQVTNMSLDVLLDTKAAVTDAIDHYYAAIHAKLAAQQANKTVAAAQEVADLDIELDAGDDAPIVRVLSSLLVYGYNTNASDIHIEPFEEKTTVRMRIDGMLIDYLTLAPSLHSSLIARIKILGNLDIAERRIPQDGHFRTKIDGVDVNTRVSVIPTVFGEKAVIRFLNSNTTIDHAGTFGMTKENYELIRRMMDSPYGIMYVTGPTGSGKTTTLYMMLEYIAQRQVNISTLEDPVERNLARINQMQVNNTAGLTFEAGLRALLRQDPDVIMVGETRDAETAEISIRSAITGHLVFSTLHTNDAISSIVRLMDMGIPRYLISSSVIGMMAQRLVRKICPYCAEEYQPDERELAILGENVPTLKRGRGCHMCSGTGYKGRIAVHEVFMIDADVRRMIAGGNDIRDIYDYAKQHGMKSLRDSAFELVKAGVTTIDEFTKIVYASD